MLRPATPLTVLLLISFVFLLLSVLSTPVIHSIPLATYQGVNFGVFGYCTPTKCSGIRVGYTTDGLFPSGDTDFSLSSSTRHSLSSLLIVHPVAAFCNLVCLALAGAAHLHSPSHSARYLLGLLILLLPTLLVTLLAFLVDILLFVPHLQWAGWIVLASTILIAASGVVTCAMRRTLVSRKARKKRIAENAEMSGENYYNRQAQESKTVAQTFTTEPTMPMVNGSPGADRLPTFATFDASQKSDEERQPLRAQALSNEPSLVTPTRDTASERYYGPPSRSSSRPPYNGPRDQFGNHPPPPPVPSAADGTTVPGQYRRSGDEPTPPSPYRDRSLPPPGPGGRGYSQRGRGTYPPRGGYPSRGGGFGPRGLPPQGYPGRGGFSTDMRGGYGGRGRGGIPPVAPGGPRRPPPGYPPNGVDSASERYSPPDEYPVAMGPPLPMAPSQQYIEDIERRYDNRSPSVYTQGEEAQGPYGARAQSPARDRTSPYGSRVQSPSGTLRRPSPPPAMPPLPTTRPVEMAGTSVRDFKPQRSQSQDPYVPPRAIWNNMSGDDLEYPRSPGRQGQSPVELPTSGSHVGGYSSQPRRPRVNSGGSDVYYEDVDPRFASDPEPPLPQNPQLEERNRRPPPLLNPGPPGHYRPDSYNEIPPTNSYEELPGARSPAESETSNFTSVSQRGVNPNWRPGPGNGGEFSGLGPMRRRDHQTRQDMLLAGNPDFELPGSMGPPRLPTRGRGGGPGMRGGMMRGPARVPPASAVGSGGDGPYPVPMGSPLPGGPMGPPGPGPGPGIAPGPGMGMGGMREI
ncbi:uncharacterized protein Z520_08535 [Fonsecaea multimorphosa CBS 102226]|uniref:PH-response regulator protein palI/RIM9 n=1 Tax=Fonsecaea multimorphosa CBS 102226 TaxID=1442371 RepID=A0A0D2JR35_9EURO|nr:uncharacterized protein Z520_08535 [Fonsecaea multimorphosa CBS 102226]KIX95827.1 hypothetical protein Z520_08535 [Fonsecaea multimorphosa CBS 102226]OAL21562.1 hypothetical protein AYO22_07958 [Fonsecaea multimorphosa]